MEITDILTNPKKHDDENFAYIVHAIRHIGDEDMEFDVADTCLAKKIRKVRSPDSFYCASLMAVLPEDVANNLGIEGDVRKIGYFGDFGLVIRPRTESIITSFSTGAGNPSNEKWLKEFAKANKGKFCSLKELQTYDNYSYNELILQGSPNTRIQAAFYLDDDYIDKAKRLAFIAEKLAGKKIPVIELPYDLWL